MVNGLQPHQVPRPLCHTQEDPHKVPILHLRCWVGAYVSHHPYLGVEIAADLSWGPHLNQTIPKAQRSLNLLRRNLYGCSPQTKEMAYKALVRPVLEYASSAWDVFQANHVKRLESIQRKAARFVTNQHQRDVSVTGLINTLGWRPLQERRLEARLCMFYKSLHGLAACPIPDYINPIATATRASHNQQYSIPTARLDTYKYSYFPRTIKTWNLLPSPLVSAPSIDSFKNGLHKEFLKGNMYVVPPRGQYDRPRLGSASSVTVVGPVY